VLVPFRRRPVRLLGAERTGPTPQRRRVLKTAVLPGGNGRWRVDQGRT
jgi:hypothetical protein